MTVMLKLGTHYGSYSYLISAFNVSIGVTSYVTIVEIIHHVLLLQLNPYLFRVLPEKKYVFLSVERYGFHPVFSPIQCGVVY